MLRAFYLNQFKRDYKKMKKRGNEMSKLDKVLVQIVKEIDLPKKLRSHVLTGNWAKHHECHIEPDWLLIYFVDSKNKSVTFSRTGTHSDLFSLFN